MSDERINDEALLAAVKRLPRGAGVIFRHYGLSQSARRSLFLQVQSITRRRKLILVIAGSERLALAWKADGFHGRTLHKSQHRHLIRTAPVHDLIEICQAERSGAHLLFLSPLFPTRSHPQATELGRVEFAFLARQARRPVVALGGMTAIQAKILRQLNAYGWAAIDGLSKTEMKGSQMPSPLKRRQTISS
ncbi:thiamine phosphate synthase [Rhizorhapis sp. SPR117]|uniref:thiamine phosphate synthase n=1 Tax=Rhizorhapis sp. SPR117 TaxID=2912611 RepID=UPI0030C8269C